MAYHSNLIDFALQTLEESNRPLEPTWSNDYRPSSDNTLDPVVLSFVKVVNWYEIHQRVFGIRDKEAADFFYKLSILFESYADLYANTPAPSVVDSVSEDLNKSFIEPLEEKKEDIQPELKRQDAVDETEEEIAIQLQSLGV